MSDDLDVDGMRELLRKEVETREKCMLGIESDGSSNAQNNGRFVGKYVSPINSASAMVTPSNSEDRPRSCIFCGKEHPSEGCTSVATLEKRASILRRQGRCFNCLRRNHMVRNCKSSSRCGRCSGKHHESICRTDENRDHNAKNESQSTIRSNDRKVAEDK